MTTFNMGNKLTESGSVDLKQKNIDFAAEAVANVIFYHFTDFGNRERLKTALKMFANIILLNNDQNVQVGNTTDSDSSTTDDKQKNL